LLMSPDQDNTVAPIAVDDQRACPTCGGPTSPHVETIIRLGHPDHVRCRYRCVDPGCHGSVLVDDSGSKRPRGVVD